MSRKKFCKLILISLVIITFIVNLLLNNVVLDVFTSFGSSVDDKNLKIHIEERQLHGPCTVPKLEPFHASVQKHLKNLYGINCTVGFHPLMFSTDLESRLIIVNDPQSLGYTDCCYSPFSRNGGDFHEKYTKECFPITNKTTDIHSEYEFIAIYCFQVNSGSFFIDTFNWIFNRKIIVDMFNFVRLKPETEERIKQIELLKSNLTDHRNITIHSTPSIVILGLDSISHMNFIRTMPKAYNYITQNLSGIGMNGYSLFEDNTFANMVPLLTGYSTEELSKICWKSSSSYFDNCPFIWKNFSDEGYRTSYAEDSISIGIFLFEKQGFNVQPTDYYMHPLMNSMGDNDLRHQGNSSIKGGYCYGPRLGLSVLLNNIKKMAVTMGHTKKYFQFTWATSLSHDDHNVPAAGDPELFDLLVWMQSEHYLENTIFILMSDHGARFSSIRESEQGSIEAKMPFLYFVFPEWFSKKYDLAISNMKSNKDKITTPLDAHETLKDLLDAKRIENDEIRQRDIKIQNSTTPPRGISLFLRIPEVSKRNCFHAEIKYHYCHCKPSITILKNLQDPEVIESGNNAVKIINRMLENHSKCAQLKLISVLHALSNNFSSNSNNSSINSSLSSESFTNNRVLTIIFKTLPNQAIFEATLFKDSTSHLWILSGSINRINKYGDQSYCVSDYRLKPYCFCT